MSELFPLGVTVVSGLAVAVSVLFAGCWLTARERIEELVLAKGKLEAEHKQLQEELRGLRYEVRSHLDWSGQLRR